ncbi:hypothetical protein QO002_001116 [Pararhizobium capsulatum DSM 1112]|uniref:Clp protease n=1 Tax=Pararhizobium capsulatum DSM 1112 TaxID=1121113 RepID=A0ABU0BL51_9HYPH|nr:hypothetical protein [Pararhizobium capsulatum]MDQ0318978.1 hypothetical protein [Pararhizobium capsulatum DSM 1112]
MPLRLVRTSIFFFGVKNDRGSVLRFYPAFLVVLMGIASMSSARAAVSIQRLPIDGGGSVLVVRGEFEFTDDPAALANEAKASGARVVTFDSNGGNIHAAMAFGRAIRSLGLETIQIRSAQCASACALAFVGGVTRTAEPGSIGVHQSSFSGDAQIDGQSAVAAVQAMTADIMTYLVEMGVDPKLLQLSLSVESSDMRYLTSSEMTQFSVTSSSSVEHQQTPATTSEVIPAAIEPSGEAAVIAPTARDQALEFVTRYHEAWSWPNTRALAFMNSAYADAVVFYGNAVSRADVLREKTVFAERWPQRAYSVKHGTEQAVCGSTCTVSAIVEWYTHSPQRAKTSSGAAEFTLTWNPATGKIESETGKVLQTDKKAREPLRIISQWERQNGDCRGGPGNSAETLRACDRRDAVGAKLDAVGWCYGREGEYGYQMEWHVCGQ